MNKETYNGWSNYATWRINLEIIDSIAWVKEDFIPDEAEWNVSDLALHLQSVAFSTVFDTTEDNNDEGLRLMRGYADAFMGDVNWYEIATHMADEHPEWNVKKN